MLICFFSKFPVFNQSRVNIHIQYATLYSCFARCCSHTYITTEFAFTYNPYECNQNLLMPGEGEKIADKLLEMLNENKGA